MDRNGVTSIPPLEVLLCSVSGIIAGRELYTFSITAFTLTWRDAMPLDAPGRNLYYGKDKFVLAFIRQANLNFMQSG